MASLTDDTTKKVMYMIKTPTGKYKLAGFYGLVPLAGDTMLSTFPNLINGPCGIEFDEVQYIDQYPRYTDLKAGQIELSMLEYND